ncbi:MAG: hypothetical protein LBH41_02545, partial [Rickettsiales bacterium]|nr:hypothetical protein [Rickettsiales bacterium]
SLLYPYWCQAISGNSGYCQHQKDYPYLGAGPHGYSGLTITNNTCSTKYINTPGITLNDMVKTKGYIAVYRGS